MNPCFYHQYYLTFILSLTGIFCQLSDNRSKLSWMYAQRGLYSACSSCEISAVFRAVFTPILITSNWWILPLYTAHPIGRSDTNHLQCCSCMRGELCKDVPYRSSKVEVYHLEAKLSLVLPWPL